MEGATSQGEQGGSTNWERLGNAFSPGAARKARHLVDTLILLSSDTSILGFRTQELEENDFVLF